MSTITRINFSPTSDVLSIHRRGYQLVTPALADPHNANALLDGEWVILVANRKIQRAATINAASNAATVRAMPLWSERGRSDVLAQAERKMTCLVGGYYQAWTRIYDAALVVGSGAAITAAGQNLKVSSIELGGRFIVGLVGHGGSADAHPVVGSVVELPGADNDYKLTYAMAF